MCTVGLWVLELMCLTQLCCHRRWWEFSWWSACWLPALCRGWLHIAPLHAGSCAMAGTATVCRQKIHFTRNTLLCLHIYICFVILSSLFRFKHPSEGELCALAGKQMPKPNRRDRWELGEGMRPLIAPKVKHVSCLTKVTFLRERTLTQSDLYF